MVSERHHRGAGRSGGITRRRLLAVGGTAAAVALAGCEGEFDTSGGGDADVGLSSSTLGDLELAATARDTQEIETADEDGDGDDPQTSEYVGYQRGPARGQPTALEAFAGTVNGSQGAGATALARPAEAGIRTVTVAFGDEEADVPASEIGVVLPSGSRSDGEVSPSRTLFMLPFTSLADYGGAWFGTNETADPTEFLELSDSNHRLVPVGEFFPDDDWLSPAGTGTEPPVGDWVGAPDDENPSQVLVVTGERTIPGAFGMGLEKRGRLVEDGEAIDPQQTVLSWPGDQFMPGGDVFLWDEIYWYPAPFGGATFGLGVFVLPPGFTDDDPAWNDDIETVLRSESGQSLLAEYVFGGDAGGVAGEGGSVFWSDAPTMIDFTQPIEYEFTPDVRGKSQLKSAVAVVETDHGREAVALHAVRIPPSDRDEVDDLVVVVGGQRAPIGDRGDAGWWDGGEQRTKWVEGGSALTATAVEGLSVSR